MAWTRDDGWVWGFRVVDHDAALAWAHVAKTGDRFAALPAGRRRRVRPLGPAGRGRGPGLSLRHDRGPQYRSGHFLGSIGWLGIADDAALLGAPEAGGCAERWTRT
jgi:transposase InsO family protein